MIGDVHDGPLPAVQELVAGYGSAFSYLAFDAGHHCYGHCVAGDSVLESADIESASRRWYSGPTIDLACGSGSLTITPNHPVLTERGWVPAGEIHEGDYLVRAPFGQRGAPSKPDIERKPTEAAQLFDSLWDFGLRQRVSGLGMQFHGDGGQGEVDVVRPDRLLWNRYKTARLQPAEHLPFAHTDLLGGDRLPGDGLSGEFLGGVPVGAAGSVAGGSQGAQLLAAHRREPSLLGIANGSRSYARLPKPVDNVGGFTVEFEAERDRGQPTFVSLDQVRQVCRRDFSGHVYNLQTSSNWYIANGLIVHNCQLNRALWYAKGKYVHVNDDDDVWAPDAVEAMRSAAQENPGKPLLFRFRSYVGRLLFWNTKGRLVRGQIGGHCLVVPTVKAGAFSCEYTGDFDWVMTSVMLCGGVQTAVWIDKVVCYARPA